MSDGFFDGVYQVDTECAGQVIKFPLFYRQVRSFTAAFPANWFKLRRLVPDWRYVPAQVMPGVGAISLTAFEHLDTDVGSYNEFAIGVLLNSRHFAPLPGYNMLQQHAKKGYEMYIHHLPVTTDIALRAGVDFYGYPKFISDIDFTDSQDSVACRVVSGGKHICTLTSKKINARRSFETKFFCHLYKDKQPQGTEFKVDVLEGAISWGPLNAGLELGDHDVAREISSVLLTRQALLHLYFPKMRAILYGPDNLGLPLVQYGLQQMAIAKAQERV